jgi:hypothetical protein
MIVIQAVTIPFATPQRTADTFFCGADTGQGAERYRSLTSSHDGNRHVEFVETSMAPTDYPLT